MTTSVSGSNDTSEIDAYRQGVELTDPKHFAVGIGKVWSGYPNHEVPQLLFGQSVLHDDSTPFEELTRYHSISYLTASKATKSVYERSLAGDVLRRSMDGSLDAFGIRSGSLDGGPVPTRGFKGAVMDGNLNEFLESEQVVTEYISYLTSSDYRTGPFVDSTALLARNTYVSGTARLPHGGVITAFTDTVTSSPSSKQGLMMPYNIDNTHRAKRLQLNPSASHERVSRNARSLGSGFIYGGTSRGVDSVAYGGLTQFTPPAANTS